MDSKNFNLPLYSPEIEKILPHRAPILLIDRVTEYVSGDYIRGIKNVSYTEPTLAGHFPGNPIFPGVLMLEALAQLGAIYAKFEDSASGLIVFAGAEDVKFRRLVKPGDTLTLTMKFQKKKLGQWKMEGTASIGDDIACYGILKAASIPN